MNLNNYQEKKMEVKCLNIKSVLLIFLRVKIGIARRNGAVGANSRSLKKMYLSKLWMLLKQFS